MFATTPDQDVLESATRRFLEANEPVERIRELAVRERTFEPDRWREGAALGWTSLLVPDEAGGGSVSGNGLADLLIVCALFGQHAAPGPLLGTNAVAAALGRWGSPAQQAGPLAELLDGRAVGAWGHTSTCLAPGSSRSTVRSTLDERGVVLSGRVALVEGACEAAHVLVTADGPEGRTQLLVPTAAQGVELVGLRGIDLTRRYDEVVLHGVVVGPDAQVGAAGSADEHDAHLLDVVATMLLGEMVGAMDRAFALTLEWTVDRYSFGRPLGSYQAVKHRVADLRTQVEASEAVAARAAEAVGRGEPDGRAWARAGMAYVAQRAPELIQECIQLYGGIGVTYEHDLHLFLRRATTDAQLFGSWRDFARDLGGLVVEAEELGVAAPRETVA